MKDIRREMFGRKKRKKDYTELTTNLQNVSGDLVRLNHTVQNASQVTHEETKKESKNLLENIDKIVKIIAAYMVTWGAVNIFLWASYISSWNLEDTAFIIQQEGIGGGVSRMFALIGSHIIPILSILVFFVSLIILIGPPVVLLIWVKAKIQRFSLTLRVLLFIIFLFILVVYLCLIACIVMGIFYMYHTFVGKYFQYWIEEDIYKLVFVICAVVLIGVFIKSYLENKGKLTGKKGDIISFAKIISSMVLIVFIVFSFFTFTSVYSKGYGTDCMYLIIKEDSSEDQKNYIYSSISSGGKNIADELSKKVDGKEHRQKCRDKDITLLASNVTFMLAEKTVYGKEKPITWYFYDNFGLKLDLEQSLILASYGKTFTQSVYDTENYFKTKVNPKELTKADFESKRKEIHSKIATS